MNTKMKATSKIYTILIFAFLYVPMLVMVIYSFNASISTTVLDGFSLRWYRTLFQDSTIVNATLNTLQLALSSSVLATIIGTAAAVGLHGWKKNWFRSSVISVTNIPLVNPDIVMGVSLMLLFIFVGGVLGNTKVLGFPTVLIAHVTFNLPYVILSVLPKLRQVDPSIAEAAQDLGCKPMQAFFKVVLPQISPGIVTGMIMAFTLSLDDFIISYFTTGPGFTTLPIAIFSMTKIRVKPTIYALSTLIFVSIFILLILINLAQVRAEKKQNSFQKEETL